MIAATWIDGDLAGLRWTGADTDHGNFKDFPYKNRPAASPAVWHCQGVGRVVAAVNPQANGAQKESRKKKKKTYSTEDSLVVTDLTTDSTVSSLSMGEQTGSRVLYYLWPYVVNWFSRSC